MRRPDHVVLAGETEEGKCVRLVRTFSVRQAERAQACRTPYELMAIHIDSDLEAAAFFAQLALALPLLALTVLRAIPRTQGLDLLMAGL
jgi:hypothetical protein